MNGKERLSELDFFKHVSDETLNELWAKGTVERCLKGTVIRRAKELNQNVYFQVSGKSVVYNLTHTGRRKIIFILGKGHMLNGHIIQNHVASLFIETIEESSIFRVPISAFINAMKKDFTLVEAVLTAQETKIWRLGHQLKNTMGSIYMERKLAAKLWKLSRDFGKETKDGIEIDLNLPITFLADMLGAPRETTSRLCSTLMEYDLIRINKKRITIVDKDRMAHFYKTGEYYL
ncbi:MAG: Crp/Fnr family transcriptional regulator [Eubacteriales bacterium]|nr:Crp/Fnr family transcriptional regulator [Eubacteriales bacterium]